MYIIIKGKNTNSSPNPLIRAKDASFMRNNHNRNAAHLILQDRLKVFEKQNKNTGEFLDHCKRRGFMKTEDDLKIVADVMKKARLPKGEVPEKKSNKFMKEVRNNWKNYKREIIKGKKL